VFALLLFGVDEATLALPDEGDPPVAPEYEKNGIDK
jgi:hypothetical protein